MHVRSSFLALLVAVAACGAPVDSGSALQVPPDSAPPDVVLQAYLRALLAGDCATVSQLAAATFHKGNGELCGSVRVSAARIDGPPATPTATEDVFGTTITTNGSPDGSIQPGETIWFYDLIRQPNGAWRIAGGGTGP